MSSTHSPTGKESETPAGNSQHGTNEVLGVTDAVQGVVDATQNVADVAQAVASDAQGVATSTEGVTTGTEGDAQGGANQSSINEPAQPIQTADVQGSIAQAVRELSITAPTTTTTQTRASNRTSVRTPAVASSSKRPIAQDSDDSDAVLAGASRKRTKPTPKGKGKGKAVVDKSNTAAVAKAKATIKAKGKGKIGNQLMITANDRTDPKESTHAMTDRLNTISRREAMNALQEAISTVVSDNGMKKSIASAATSYWHTRMASAVAQDKNSKAMKSYLATSKKPPTFGFAKKQKAADTPKGKGKGKAVEEEEYEEDGDEEYQEQESDESDGEADEEEESENCKTLTQDTEQHDTNANITPRSTDGHHGKVSDDHKFYYCISCTLHAEKLANNNAIVENSFRLPELFIDRLGANEKLHDMTQYDKFEGGMTAVSRRNVYEDTPLKLLKVELTLNTGEERVLWVERCIVNLNNDLTKRARALKMWSAVRPKLPHYIVECEFMTRKTTESKLRLEEESNTNKQVEQHQQETSDDDDDDVDTVAAASSSSSSSSRPPPDDADGGSSSNDGFTGDIELDRLPLATFTDRTLANDYAGDLFLRHSAVDRAIRGPLDDFWWANNAVPIHRDAEQRVAGGGLYVAELYTLGMQARLGYEWIRVAVYAVEDVRGPLNV